MNFSRLVLVTFLSLLIAVSAWLGEAFIIKTTSIVSAWSACKTNVQSNQPQATVHYTKESPASLKPTLTWTKVEGAVAYELELLNQIPENSNRPAPTPYYLFSTTKIYVNGYNADLSHYDTSSLYWRVRALDSKGKPLSQFSSAEPLSINSHRNSLQKPLITSIFNQSPGGTLLYPVYSWIPIAGAEKYEVEILDAPPENPNSTSPSSHRISAAIARGFDYYDTTARRSDQPFYWRVRGLTVEGDPVGVFSDAGAFTVSPHLSVTVATYGDSITHGGGSISYSPADWEYSYQHYLSFPTINLGKSGDTSEALVERFDEDVLPFHPQYLLIMGGTNSLRGGTSASEVIADLSELKEKCLVHGIKPIFLTLPPINPAHIKEVFDEPTVSNWQEQFRLVNQFIRTQTHIDVARDIGSSQGVLLPNLAVDGLHLDIQGKKQIAKVINSYWLCTNGFHSI